MTEYDYSPEAFEAHFHKQQGIARWVDKTSQFPQKNPFTPATPAVQALELQRGLDSDDDYDSTDDRSRRHRRRVSKDHRDRDHHRDRDRGMDRDRGLDRQSSRHHHSQSESARPHTKRHRSASQSASTHRPEPSRQYSVPPPLPIPPHPRQASPTAVYPQYQYPVPYPPKLTSPRDSKHSSRSSSTQVPSPSSYFPPQAQGPYSAPPHKQMPVPVRSQTSPTYGHPQDNKYSYPVPYYPPGYPTSPIKPIDLANAPQLPYSAYQVKQPPLLKRIFTNLLHLNKPPQPPPRRRRQRNNSF